jgi:hypothetical protein
MSKQNKSIQEKLAGRTPVNMRQVIKPVDMLDTEQGQQAARTNERSSEQTNKRTSERKNERMRVRHSFDIFQDQLLSLKEIAINRQKVDGERVLLGDLVQEALDKFIANERKNERPNEPTDE